MKLLQAAFMGLVALTLVACASTQPQQQPYSEQQLISLLSDVGFTDIEVRESGNILFMYDDLKAMLVQYDDGDLQLYCGFTGYEISYRDINSWNAEYRLSRAYLDEERDPIIESDLLANGGLTPDQIREFFEVYKLLVDTFHEYLHDHNQA